MASGRGIYIYMHMHMYIHICFINLYTTSLLKDKGLCAYLDIHVCMFTYTHIYMRVYTYECNVYTCSSIYICMYVYICMDIYNAYIDAHTQIKPLFLSRAPHDEWPPVRASWSGVLPQRSAQLTFACRQCVKNKNTHRNEVLLRKKSQDSALAFDASR